MSRLQQFLNDYSIIDECIVIAKKFGEDIILGKNRDRNYTPEIKIVRELAPKNIEICYLMDQETNWTEGMNSEGIGIVNTALMVTDDEKEIDKVKSGRKKSKDGIRVKEALRKGNIENAIKSLLSFEGGIKGHTMISDGVKLAIIENTSRVKPIVKYHDLSKQPLVRTNHGIEHPEQGYTEGEDAESSNIRYDNSLKLLKSVDNYKKLFPLFFNHTQDKGSKFDLVRTQNKLYTSSQLLMNLNKREMILYLIPGAVKFLGFENNVPKNYEPKINMVIRQYQSSPNNKYGVFVKTTKDIDKSIIKDIDVKV